MSTAYVLMFASGRRRHGSLRCSVPATPTVRFGQDQAALHQRHGCLHCYSCSFQNLLYSPFTYVPVMFLKFPYLLQNFKSDKPAQPASKSGGTQT